MISLRSPKAPQGFFASPTGLPGNSGSVNSPWDLQTALNGGSSGQITPGSSLWVRGGTYNGLYVALTNGTQTQPIRVKAYPGERVTIDGYVTTTLGGTINSAVTSIPMPQLNVPDGTVIDVDSEAIRLHSYSAGNYVGVDRGWNGTTAAGHTVGATIYTESGQCLSLQGTWTQAWYIETTVSVSRYANRVNPQAGSNPFGRIAGSIDIQGTGNQAIICWLHDCADGGTTANIVADNFSFIGCISYYNGWDASDRGHGHNFYIHNDNPLTSAANLIACISLAAFDLGVQVFTGGSTLGNVTLDGFISAQAGMISSFGAQLSLLMGLDPGPLTASTLKNSAIYSNSAVGDGVSVGYAGGTTDGFTLTNNYAASQSAACIVKPAFTNLTTFGNTWVGPSSAPNPASGTFLSWKPVSGKVFVVTPVPVETGRAHIAVFNWDQSATVDLDLSTTLRPGDPYVIRNAWNYFGTPLAKGTYTGAPVTVNASGLTIAAPVGLSAPAETGPEFNVYVVAKA